MEQNFKNLNLDLKVIKDYGLTIDKYLVLLYKYLQSKGIQSEYFNPPVLYNSVSELLSSNWLDIDGNLLPKALELFESKDDKFEEFYNTFPQRVPSGRPLRATTVNSKAGKVTHKKWLKEVNKSDRNKVIQLLKKQVEFMQFKGNLEYLNNIDTWLNQHVWEKYEYLLNTNVPKKLKNDDI
jgi:hypothetical protein